MQAEVNRYRVKIKLSTPCNIKTDISLKVLGKTIKAHYIDTGVPHVVVFVEGLDKIDVEGIGRVIRFNRRFSPRGANVDFVEINGENKIRVRTYERGVEGETLACGTGAAASAAALAIAVSSGHCCRQKKIAVFTRGGAILKIYFKQEQAGISDLWLEGKASLVYSGMIEKTKR